MSRTRQRTRILLLLALGVTCALVLGVWLVQNESEEGHIHPNQVTLDNMEAFEIQVRRDLPIGTDKEDVEAFLTNWSIEYEYFAPDYGSEHYANSYRIVLSNIGTRVFFPASLIIYIHLDESDMIREIVFRDHYK